MDNTSSTFSNIPSNRATISRHNNNCKFKRIQFIKGKKNPMEIDINTSTFLNSHNNTIYPKHLDPSNHTNTVLSFDSSIDHISPTVNKKKITTCNQHQVSEIKHFHIYLFIVNRSILLQT